ncbi:MAG TPA: DUF4381 domain-containing protein [Alphaproteobacteria bacterium]|jgi:hypothetical protein|nr:DUF4381 domain-containing protein [Alphaproteobacteria bacterium]
MNEPLDATTRAALQKLADIVQPGPVAWWPQTWGWLALAILMALLSTWRLVHWLRVYRANRYRREALAELDRLDGSLTGTALAMTFPALLKRTALAAWPRAEVAALSGDVWVAFLRAGGPISDETARLLNDLEYRGADLSDDEALMAARAVRAWILDHHVSACHVSA